MRMSSEDVELGSGIYELAPEEPVKPAERWVPPQQAKLDAKPLPCPECGYDLRGLRDDTCPECGLKLTYGVMRRAQDARSGVRPPSGIDKKSIIMAVIGLTLSAAIGWLSNGSTGFLSLGADFVLTVAIGWVVFFVSSIAWIGFDQPLRTTLLQTIGAFGMFAGIWAVMTLIPVPGLVRSVIGFLILTALLADALDIDYQDAGIIAIVVSVMKFALWMSMLALLGP